MAGACGYVRLSDRFSIPRLTPEEWRAGKRSAIGPYRE
jgi:hypothetical protein